MSKASPDFFLLGNSSPPTNAAREKMAALTRVNEKTLTKEERAIYYVGGIIAKAGYGLHFFTPTRTQKILRTGYLRNYGRDVRADIHTDDSRKDNTLKKTTDMLEVYSGEPYSWRHLDWLWPDSKKKEEEPLVFGIWQKHTPADELFSSIGNTYDNKGFRVILFNATGNKSNELEQLSVIPKVFPNFKNFITVYNDPKQLKETLSLYKKNPDIR